MSVSKQGIETMKDMELDIDELSNQFSKQQVLNTAIKIKKNSPPIFSPPAVQSVYSTSNNKVDQATPATLALATHSTGPSTNTRRRRRPSLLAITNIVDDRADTCTPEPAQAAAPRCPRKRHSRLSSPHVRQHRGQLSFSSTGSKRNYSRSRIYLKKNTRNLHDASLAKTVARRIGGSKRKLHMSPFASEMIENDGHGILHDEEGSEHRVNENAHRMKRAALGRRKSLLGLSNASVYHHTAHNIDVSGCDQ